MQLVVIAKEPVPGRVKTRLCPPCTPDEAAGLAAAALADTLAAVRATPARRHVLVLDGRPGPWVPPGFTVLPQRGDGLAERLAAAVIDTAVAATAATVTAATDRAVKPRAAAGTATAGTEPVIVIGMDTPQVTPELLTACARSLAGDGEAGPDRRVGAPPARRAVLGPATDGGYWLIGLSHPDPAVFDGVPMSADDTGERQLERLHERGFAVELAPSLVDVDTITDAETVAATAPHTAFARRLDTLRTTSR